jgi:hypothetical protein
LAQCSHRDLHWDDVAAAGARLLAALQLVADSLPDSALDFLSPLADGADPALQAIERDGGDAADLLAALGKEIVDENANWLRLYLERRIQWHGK